MSRRTARSCVALAVMAAAGVLAGPAAGQSSVWYNTTTDGMDVAQTTNRPWPGRADQTSLGILCVSGRALAFQEVRGPGTDSIAEAWSSERGKEWGYWSDDYFAFRFDGRPDTEIVLEARFNVMPNRPGRPGVISLLVRESEALIPSLRSADYVETARPGGSWDRWTLRGAATAIDRLPCMGGGR